MKTRLYLSALLAVLAMTALALPAVAHTGHTTMEFTCADPSPNGASQNGKSSCSFTLNPGGDFGSTDNDKTDWVTIYLPVDAKLNEDGTHDGADPSDGEKIGESTVAGDFGYNGCPGGTPDGGTYSTYWEDSWTSYTAPSGWTKVAQYNTVFTVAFFFTRNVPTHVIKNNSTGQYAAATDIPQADGCAGSETVFDPLVTYGKAQDRNNQEWVGQNPSTAGDYDVCIVAKEVGGTEHEDCDTITIS